MSEQKNIYFLLILLIPAFISCNMFSGNEKERSNVIAKAYEYNLYSEDFAGIIPAGTSKADSVIIVKNFIDNWIRRKSVLHKAEQNLSSEKKDVNLQLEEYRNSLVTYAYEKELVDQRLDTTVEDAEVSKYYQSHLQNFELKDNIIKVIYLRLNKKSPDLDKVRNWYRSTASKDRELLEDYCQKYALNYYLDDKSWLFFDDLLKEIPIRTYDKEQFLQNNRAIEISDSSQIYFVNIVGFMIKNSTSPLSFEKKNIISMIMNERKLKLIDDMEKQAYEDAKRSKEVQIF